MKKLLVAAAIVLLPAYAMAQFHQADWELTLSGQGSNDKDFRTGSAAVNGSLGYFFTDQMELALRQGVVWSDGGSTWNGDTRVALDYHFDMGRWVPFVGANIGYQYGETINDAWIAGPEIGVKYFINSTTFAGLSAAYEFDLNEGLDNGAFFYGLLLGVRL